MSTSTETLVAWRVATRGFPDAAIVAAPGRNRARAICLTAAHDAGFMVAWSDLDVRRAPEFDAWVVALGRERCWNEEYAARLMAEDAKETVQEAPGRSESHSDGPRTLDDADRVTGRINDSGDTD